MTHASQAKHYHLRRSQREVCGCYEKSLCSKWHYQKLVVDENSPRWRLGVKCEHCVTARTRIQARKLRQEGTI